MPPAADPSLFAEATAVPIHKSREEIAALLRTWGCTGVQWTDDWMSPARFTLRFAWPFEGQTYMARLMVALPPDEKILRGYPARGRIPRSEWLEREREQHARRLHRLLAMKLKMDLNAVHSGVLTVAEAILPFLEGPDGRTVSEVAQARLPELLGRGAAGLLEDHRGR